MDKARKITKDFLGWMQFKISLHNLNEAPYFYEREIWWVSIGHNVGWEEDGKGNEFSWPVVVVRKFNKFLFWGVPLTTTERKGKYYLNFKYKEDQISTAIVSQLRSYDSKRLSHKDGMMPEGEFDRLQKQIARIATEKSPQK